MPFLILRQNDTLDFFREYDILDNNDVENDASSNRLGIFRFPIVFKINNYYYYELIIFQMIHF